MPATGLDTGYYRTGTALVAALHRRGAHMVQSDRGFPDQAQVPAPVQYNAIASSPFRSQVTTRTPPALAPPGGGGIDGHGDMAAEALSHARAISRYGPCGAGWGVVYVQYSTAEMSGGWRKRRRGWKKKR